MLHERLAEHRENLGGRDMSLDRAAARARCEAATPGPWEAHVLADGIEGFDDDLDNCAEAYVFHPYPNGYARLDAAVEAAADLSDCFAPVAGVNIADKRSVASSFNPFTGECLDGSEIGLRPGNAIFIAHARADLPAALDLLDAQDKRIAELEADNAKLRADLLHMGERLKCASEDIAANAARKHSEAS
jgi:hypothetical protein